MSIFRPKHPLLKAVFAIGSGLFYLLTIPWVRRQLGKMAKRPFERKGAGKVVDAKGTVVEK